MISNVRNSTKERGKKVKSISKKAKEFNDYRFSGLNWFQKTNNYLSMDRVSEDEKKIVVKVAAEHIKPTKYGYALILDDTHVVFIKDWQVSSNYYGNEVLLQEEFFNVKEWGNFDEFGDCEENLNFATWLEAAKEQEALIDEDGYHINPVRWEI